MFCVCYSIYQWQDEHQSFTTVPNLLLSMSDELMNSTTMSFRDLCVKWGLSEQLISELAVAAGRNNYGQTVDNLSGLVGELGSRLQLRGPCVCIGSCFSVGYVAMLFTE